jgi:hypothetical protein
MESPLYPTEPQTSMNPTPEKKHRSVMGWNLLFLGIYFFIFLVLASVSRFDEILFIYMYAYLGHALVLLIIAMVRIVQQRNREAAEYFLTAIALPIIGYGACSALMVSGLFFGTDNLF